ncbi:MAG: hypothetical protein ABIT38_24520 [Gemmatimonadaceae bacterium]
MGTGIAVAFVGAVGVAFTRYFPINGAMAVIVGVGVSVSIIAMVLAAT